MVTPCLAWSKNIFSILNSHCHLNEYFKNCCEFFVVCWLVLVLFQFVFLFFGGGGDEITINSAAFHNYKAKRQSQIILKTNNIERDIYQSYGRSHDTQHVTIEGLPRQHLNHHE